MRIFVPLILSITLAVLFFSNPAYALLGECQPYGDIIFDGQPVEDGLSVKAFIGEIITAATTTAGGGYSITIPPDNPDTSEKDGWVPSDTITIKVDGKIATPSFTAFLGSERHDLQITTLDVQLDTWGKIKALFK